MSVSSHDHELNIGGTIKRIDLVRDSTGRAMYTVVEEIPRYQNPFEFTQQNWIGGHGQADFADGEVYFEGQAIDTTQEGRVFLGPLKTEVLDTASSTLDSAPVCFCWLPAATARWLCATSGKIYWLNNSALWQAATTTVANVLDIKVFNGIAYAAVAGTTKYYYSTDGNTWTQTDLTDGIAHGFLAAPNSLGTATVLWKWKNPNELSNTTDGHTVAGGGVQWTSPAYIGDTSVNIQNLFLLSDNLMIGKKDGLYNYDSYGGVHPLLSELKTNQSSQNFKYVTDWQGAKYFSLVSGMGEIVGYNSYEPMGPLQYCEDIAKAGSLVGLAADKDWVYVAVDEGTNTHIYKGREVSKGGTLRWQWCPWVFCGTTAVATMAIAQHSDTDRRLWFGYGTHTAYVVLSDNPTADSAARFDTSNTNWIRMSYIYGTNRQWDKLFQSIITETKGCSSTQTVTPKYRANTSTAATTLTAAIITNGTVKTYLTAVVSCKRIQFQLDLYTTNSTLTPEVSYFNARGFEEPTVVRVHEAVYAVGDTPSRRVDTLRTYLRGARSSTALVRFADLRYGDSVADAPTPVTYAWVFMQPGYPQEVEVTREKGREPELGIKCRWQEVDYT